MEVELERAEHEDEISPKIFEAAGGYAPTVGILGAVLGLIHVMENLSDPGKLGAGIAVAFDTGIQPTMGLSLLLKGVIAAIIGGIGNVYGGILGAFFLAAVENIGAWQFSGEWKDAVAFGILIIFLLFRSQGIWPK